MCMVCGRYFFFFFKSVSYVHTYIHTYIHTFIHSFIHLLIIHGTENRSRNEVRKLVFEPPVRASNGRRNRIRNRIRNQFEIRLGKMAKTDSSQFLSTIIGQSVHVKLHSGMLYRGRLESIDGFMNVALSSAQEHYESSDNGLLRTYPTDVFLRGTQVMYISEVV